MRSRPVVFLPVIVVFLSSFSPGGLLASETTPYLAMDHWAYTYIDILQARGVFPNLWRSTRPYNRAELLTAVDEALAGGGKLTGVEREWLRLLKKELGILIEQTEDRVGFRLEGRVSTDRARDENGEGETDADYFAGLELCTTFPHVALLARTVIDQDLLEDPFYQGRKDIDWAANIEDAYALVNASKLTFFFGRTRRNLGPAPVSLFLSNNPSPFDHLFLGLDFGWVQYSFMTARLDNMYEDELMEDEIPFQRYLSLHRFDLRPIPSLEIGLFEAVVYGGRGSGLDFSFSNPVSLYFVVENASDKEANSFLGFDAYYRAWDTLGLFGQLLIDDVKISLFGKHVFYNDEVEPNEFAYVIGGELIDPLGLNDTRLTGSYTKVTNYTYNSTNVFERYTYEGKPLGHPGGNDFDLIRLRWLFAPHPDIVFESEYARMRKGEGSISAMFPDAFSSSEIPFPSGTVETTDLVSIRARYQSGQHIFVDGRFGWEWKNNYLNIPDRTSDTPRFDITLGFEWGFSRKKPIGQG